MGMTKLKKASLLRNSKLPESAAGNYITLLLCVSALRMGRGRSGVGFERGVRGENAGYAEVFWGKCGAEAACGGQIDIDRR